MPVSSTGMCFAASVSRMAPRFASILPGSRPRNPSLAPEFDDGRIRAVSQHPVEPRAATSTGVTGHRAVDDAHVITVSMQCLLQLHLEPLVVRQPIPRGQRIAENQQSQRRRRCSRRLPCGRQRQQEQHNWPSTQPARPQTPFSPSPRTPYAAAMDAIPPSPRSRRIRLAARADQEPAPDRARRRRAGQHSARHRPRHRRRRGGRACRTLGLRQDQPADGAGWPGARHRRQRHAGRPAR